MAIRVSDPGASLPVYERLLSVLGYDLTTAPAGGLARCAELSIEPMGDADPTTGLHIGLVAPDPGRIEIFWAVGIELGLRSDGEPGPRPQYGDDYFGAFLIDPDGNSVEAAWHSNLRTGAGCVDHVWMRVDEFASSLSECRAAASRAGLIVAAETEGLIRLRGPAEGGSLTLTDGPPTRGLRVGIGGSTSRGVLVGSNEIRFGPPAPGSVR